MKDKSSLNIPNRKLTFLVQFCKCLMMKSALANKKLKKLKKWLIDANLHCTHLNIMFYHSLLVHHTAFWYYLSWFLSCTRTFGISLFQGLLLEWPPNRDSYELRLLKNVSSTIDKITPKTSSLSLLIIIIPSLLGTFL